MARQMMTKRTVDDLGRIQIHKAIREDLQIKAGDDLLLYVNMDIEIVLCTMRDKGNDKTNFN